MQNREKKINGEELHQVINYFLIKSNEEKIFNFAAKLSGSSFLVLVETLISTRYYAKQLNADSLAAEFKNAKAYLENAAPNCGIFAKGFFKCLTDINSNLYTQPEHKTTSELQTLVKEKKDFPYVIHIYLPQHIYTILVTACSTDRKPHGYIYQTNTAKDLGGEKFSIQQWMGSHKNTAIDVLDHLSKVDILLDPSQDHELKKKIYEIFYTIPISDEVRTFKDLDKLVTTHEERVRWNIGNVIPNTWERLTALYQESIEELNRLKMFFDISPKYDFVAKFSEKLQNEEIILEEEPDLEIALKHLLERRKTMEPNNNNVDTAPETKISKPSYMYGYSYFGGVEDSDSEKEENLSEVKSLETATTTEHPKVQPSSPRFSR